MKNLLFGSGECGTVPENEQVPDNDSEFGTAPDNDSECEIVPRRKRNLPPRAEIADGAYTGSPGPALEHLDGLCES